MRKIISFSFLLLALWACTSKKKEQLPIENNKAEVKNNGALIIFPNNKTMLSFFTNETVSQQDLSTNFSATAKIAATVVNSEQNSARNLVLFDNPDLTANYTAFIQHQININQIRNVNIKQKRIEYNRFKDLAAHGAATERDVLEAQTLLAIEETNLQNEKAAIIEHEAKLKLAGFNPEDLIKQNQGNVWLICDVPESQINKLKIGNKCDVKFSSFPDENYTGKIQAFGDVVDNLSRMIKMRIQLNNKNGKLKAGMFAVVSFQLSEGELLSVPNTSIVTVQGKNYVFVQKSNYEFERKEIITGQQINDRIIVFDGIDSGDKVITKGTMQLKGLSFGY